MNSLDASTPILNREYSVTSGPIEEAETARRVYLITLGALGWDMVSSLRKDLLLVKSIIVQPTILAYFLTRTSVLVTLVRLIFISSRPTHNHCVAIEPEIGILYALALSSSSFLFLRRVHAVFRSHRWVRHCFSFLWISNVILSTVLFTIASTEGNKPTPTGSCIDRGVSYNAPVGNLAWLCFDSLVFFVTSYGIAAGQGTNEDGPSWSTMMFGHTLPRLPKALLRGGQQYYLVALIANVSSCVLTIAPLVPSSYRLLFVTPLALMAVMACRVFRDLRFDDHRSQFSSLVFSRADDSGDRRPPPVGSVPATPAMIPPEGHGGHTRHRAREAGSLGIETGTIR